MPETPVRLKRDPAGRFLPRAKPEADELDNEEEFNLDALLASPPPALVVTDDKKHGEEAEKHKRKKPRKTPPPLPERRDGLGRGGGPDKGGPGGVPT